MTTNWKARASFITEVTFESGLRMNKEFTEERPQDWQAGSGTHRSKYGVI